MRRTHRSGYTCRIGLGLRFQKDLRFAIEAQRAVIRRVGITVDRDGSPVIRTMRSRSSIRALQSSAISSESPAVGASASVKAWRQASARADGVEAFLPGKAQSSAAIIKTAVAERHDRYSQRAVSVKVGPQTGAFIRKACPRRSAYRRQGRPRQTHSFPRARRSRAEIAHLERHVEATRGHLQAWWSPFLVLPVALK